MLKFIYTSLLLLPLISFVVKAQTVPTPDHVVVVVCENHGYADIVGSSSAPYINSLATDAYGALFTNSHGVTHPSQPNYMYLFSGDNQNVILDYTPLSFLLPFTSDNLGAELLHHGRTFIGYSEDLPSVGFTGDNSGAYARKHSPWICWQGTGTNGIASSLNQPLTSFPTNYNNLPTLSFVIPNLNDDMHDGTITASDSWLQSHLDGYVQWAKTHNSLLILTFDEDDNYLSNNQVATIFIGQMVKSGQYSESIDHNKVLRTMEDMYGTGHAGSSAGETPIVDCWVYHTTALFNGTPTTLCQGQTTTFTDHSTNVPTGWSWYFQGGNPTYSTAQNPTVTYDTAGVYDVRLVASNHMGPDTAYWLSTIVVNPHPSLTFNQDTVGICPGDTATVVAHGATTYHWFPAAGQISIAGDTLKANPSSNASYTVTGSANGCLGDTVSVTIIANSTPTISSFTNSVSICSGDTATIILSGASAYQIQPASGLVAITGDSLLTSPSSDEIFIATGTSNGCVSDTIQVAVHVKPLPVVTFSGVDSINVCLGDTAMFLLSGADTYNTVSGNGTLQGALFLASPPTSTVYQIVGIDSGCTGLPLNLSVHVNPLPAVTVAADSGVACGGSTHLVAQGAIEYSWSPSTGLNVDTGSTVIANTSGTYQVFGLDSNQCYSTTVDVTVVVSHTVIPTITAVDSSLSSTTANGYQWFYNGNAIPGATAQTYVADSSGIYTVQTTNADGCFAISDTVAVHLSSVGIGEITSANQFTIVPNPSNGNFKIMVSNPSNQPYQLSLYNTLGQVVYQSSNSQSTLNLELNYLPKGLYSLVMVLGQSLSTKQVILQ